MTYRRYLHPGPIICAVVVGLWMMLNSHRYSFLGGLFLMVLGWLVGFAFLTFFGKKTV